MSSNNSRFGWSLAVAAAAALHAATADPSPAQGVLCAGRDYLSTYKTPGQVGAVAVRGDFAYLADSGAGLLILDVSDPSAPALVRTLALPGSAGEIAVEGQTVYIVDSIAGLLVVDVSDPAAPDILGSHAGVNGHLALSNGVACVGFDSDAGAGVELIGVSNPEAPIELSRILTGSAPFDIAAADGRLYIATQDDGLWIMDISNPQAPEPVGEHPGEAIGVAISGSLAYLIADDRLSILDVSDPAAPILLSTTETLGRLKHISVVGAAAYIATPFDGLLVFDASSPTSPVWTGSYDNLRVSTLASAVKDSLAYTAHSGGLSIIDVSRPKQPLLAQYETPGFPNDIVFAGTTAFIADANAGLRTLDLSDPANPVPLGAFDAGGGATAVAIDGAIAYLGDAEDGLFILDVSDPAHPTALAQNPELSYVSAVAASGGAVYAARGAGGQHPNGLWIFDATDPRDPAFLGRLDYGWDFDGRIKAISIAGYYACILRGNTFAIVDASNPASPVEVGSYTIPSAEGLAVQGDVAYVAFGSGMLMLDISDPLQPSPLADYFPGGPARDIAVAGSLVYWSASYLSGLRIADASDPLAVAFLGDFQTGWQAGAISVSNGIACVGSAYYEVPMDLAIIDTRDCPPCPADLDQSGTLDLFDFLAFLNFFNAADPAADCDENAALDLFDFLCFVNLFNEGC